MSTQPELPEEYTAPLVDLASIASWQKRLRADRLYQQLQDIYDGYYVDEEEGEQ